MDHLQHLNLAWLWPAAIAAGAVGAGIGLLLGGRRR